LGASFTRFFALAAANPPAGIVDWPRWGDYSQGQVVARNQGTSGGRLLPESGMNLPNSLTILRIFFVPLLVVVLLTRSPNVILLGVPVHFEVWGVLILALAAITDGLDGYFARRRGEVTTLGILLDPLADKLLISAAFISIVDMSLVPAWMVVIIIGREFIVLGLRNIASAEGMIIEASRLGKTKMVLQVVAACTVILSRRDAMLKVPAYILLWLVVLSAVISAVHYFLKFWGQLDDRIKQRRLGLRILDRRKKSEDVATP
jgi:CDP-diacylglycerol--glycerol-3-phosphate 3-phosphatidyltransferase